MLTLGRIVAPSGRVGSVPRRHFWHWLNIIFNKVDKSRVESVGPELACAEWLLRNGAAVRWSGAKGLTQSYNSLAGGGGQVIAEVDATGSSISHYGFPHFKPCENIAKLTLHDCSYIDDDAIRRLDSLKSPPLRYLQISKCPNVTDKGLLDMPILAKLEKLVLYDLISVKNLQECESHIKKIMPQCQIENGTT